MSSLKKDCVENWAYISDFLTVDECKKIIELGNSLEKKQASMAINKLNNSYRKNKVSWINECENSRWIYDKLTYGINYLNDNFFNFDLFGFSEPLQFTEYKELNDGYKKHIDKSHGRNIRKLSISIQLSDPNDYEGNELILHIGEPQIMGKKQGMLIAFPSYTLHEVTPLLKGERYSLVSWVGGPQFK